MASPVDSPDVTRDTFAVVRVDSSRAAPRLAIPYYEGVACLLELSNIYACIFAGGADCFRLAEIRLRALSHG